MEEMQHDLGTRKKSNGLDHRSEDEKGKHFFWLINLSSLPKGNTQRLVLPAVRRRSLSPRGPAWSLRTSTPSAYMFPRKQASGITGALRAENMFTYT